MLYLVFEYNYLIKFNKFFKSQIHLQEFTHIDSVETCRQYLAAHEWDVERAIETALISDIDLPTNTNDDNNRITTDDYPSPSAPPMREPDLDEPTTERPASNATTTTDHYTPNLILYVL